MPLNIDFQQILLHMFNVVLLFGILYLLLYKPVKDFMDKRVKEYADMDAEAKEALGKAKQEQETYEQKLQSVYKEIARLRETAVKERETEVAQILESANAQAASILAKARAEGAAEHDRLIQSAGSELRDMITSAAQKLTYKDVSDAYDSFLNAGNKTDSGKGDVNE